MSDTSESLRRKIEGAAELQSVVRTMKALAASSIAQYERAVISLDDYYRTVELGLSACLHRQGRAIDAGRGKIRNRCAAVVFGSDQGLVGQFNEVLSDFVLDKLQTIPGDKRILAVGERVQGHLAERGVQREFSVPNSIAAITQLVGSILTEIESMRGGLAEVYLFHNRPKSGAVYEPVMLRLLPLDAAWRAGLAGVRWPTGNLPEVIGSNESTMEALMREYLFISIFRACAESLASENASRLVAMRRAEKNIDELLHDLNQDFHRLRQTGIDEELFDVIAGYELLTPAASMAPQSSRSTCVPDTKDSASDSASACVFPTAIT